MKHNVKDYLWDNLLMEFSLVMLWASILYVVTHNDFFILTDIKIFTAITSVGTIVWTIGLIREVMK